MKSARPPYTRLSILISMILIICLFILKPPAIPAAINSLTMSPMNLRLPRKAIIPEKFRVYESSPEIIEDVHPLSDTAAVHSVYSMKFRAAEMQGKPVKSYIQYPVTFLPE
ncbi:MAG: hypothetical protein SVK54_05130 [candidate division WOR-3 bacterium]|nr:hypothetical protein [candidate division WOR-3 bacterium]